MDQGAEGSNMIFVVGQSSFNESAGEKSYASIACLDLAYHLTLVAEYKMPSQKYLGATAMRRLRPNTNEFAIGVFRSIVIVEYGQSTFTELMLFEDIHSSKTS